MRKNAFAGHTISIRILDLRPKSLSKCSLKVKQSNDRQLTCNPRMLRLRPNSQAVAKSILVKAATCISKCIKR